MPLAVVHQNLKSESVLFAFKLPVLCSHHDFQMKPTYSSCYFNLRNGQASESCTSSRRSCSESESVEQCLRFA
jgi:hypothetical protein